MRAAVVVSIFLASLLAYARFVEPRILNIERTTISLDNANSVSSPVKLALFSDTHLGVFRNAMPMQRIVDSINSENPDAVLIAGDFLYHLAEHQIPVSLAPIGDIRAPVYAVLGNHDVGFPGADFRRELKEALRRLGVILVENQAHSVVLGGRKMVIAGASDLWENQQDFSFSSKLSDVPVLLLTHNPDTAYEMPADVHYDLMLAGHTHGGQIRIPGLFRSVIPTDHAFDKGLHRIRMASGERQVFVTPGTGMVGLPMRLGMPPRIDILTLRVPEA